MECAVAADADETCMDVRAAAGVVVAEAAVVSLLLLLLVPWLAP